MTHIPTHAEPCSSSTALMSCLTCDIGPHKKQRNCKELDCNKNELIELTETYGNGFFCQAQIRSMRLPEFSLILTL